MISKPAQRVRAVAVGFSAAGAAFLIGGCGGTSYATPNASGANLKTICRQTAPDGPVGDVASRKPMAVLPTAIAAVRVQAPGYWSHSVETYGEGDYRVLTTREVESTTDLSRLAKLPMVTGIAPLNRLVLPKQLHTDAELREGAAAMHADVLLVYTFDTSCNVEDHLSPLSFATLGLSPTVTTSTYSTASAVLLDTHTGYVYGYADATAHDGQLTNCWMIQQASDDAGRRSEAAAFAGLVDNLQITWRGVVKNINDLPPAQVPQR